MKLPQRHEIRILRIVDHHDPRILRFCQSVCEENGADPEYFSLKLSYEQTRRRFAHLDPSRVEEIWKFGPKKWSQTLFDNIECLIWMDQVIGMSGCRRYTERLLRVSMHLYTLEKFRAQCRDFQFAQDGLFSRHLHYAQEKGDVDALFFTVYPHSRKLKNHIKNLAVRRLGPRGKNFFMKELKVWEEPLAFHNVPQHFFFYSIVPHFQFKGVAPEPLFSQTQTSQERENVL